MIGLWTFALRVAIAASYATLVIFDPATAQTIVFPYAVAMLLIFVYDFFVDVSRRGQT